MKWFQKAIEQHGRSLDGWHASQSARLRRVHALSSRPSGWTSHHKDLSVGRALQALANVTRDAHTKAVASADARYFLRKLK